MTLEENKSRIEHNYRLLKQFEKEKLGESLHEALTNGFSSEENRLLLTVKNYLDFELIHFLWQAKSSSTDLAVMAVLNSDISAGLYSIVVSINSLEKEHPREIRNYLFQSYLALKEFVKEPLHEVKKLLVSPLLRSSQIRFIEEFYAQENWLTEDNSSYEIIREPFFHFKHKQF